LHESLTEVLEKPHQRKGKKKQQPMRFRYRPPAMAVELTDRWWTVKELLYYPLL